MKSNQALSPSGDKQIGRLLAEVLKKSGAEVASMPQFTTYGRSPDSRYLNELKCQADAYCQELLTLWQSNPAQRPDLWFTYHLYYKSPDLVGPTLATTLNIPYVVAEASYAPKRDLDDWHLWQRQVLQALQKAHGILCFSQQDRHGLEKLGLNARLFDLPVPNDWEIGHSHCLKNPYNVRLLTCAMMRDKRKFDNFGFLAKALAELPDRFTLTIIGDGPKRPEIEQIFTNLDLNSRISWLGLLDRSRVEAQMDQHDLFVWPGLNEPLGLVYLEAQARGLPVVAIDSGGVASMMAVGRSSMLLDATDVAAYARQIEHLADDGALYQAMSLAALDFVRTRSVKSVAGTMKSILAQIL